jgi:hypothetical protein
MTDNPLRDSVGPGNSIQTPYGPAAAPTTRLVPAVLWGTWAVLFVLGLIYVNRYALSTPFVDEWAFVPVLFGDEPRGPWLWAWHNEHRFPLPRVVYLAAFFATGELRAACFLNFVGISLIAAGMMRLARFLRGRSAYADVAFPLLLMHTGQGENLYMGYQLCFLLVTALAGAFLAAVLTTRPDNHFRRGLQAGLIGLALLTCGAGGLVYGGAATAWMAVLAVRGTMSPVRRGLLILVGCLTPLYAIQYVDGYRRPSHHPESAGVVESARIGLQAQAMAFGPAATGSWPVSGVAVAGAGLFVTGLLARRLLGPDWARSLGMLGVVVASAAVAFGIGWGRSGFWDDMGFAWRYGWLTVPAVLAGYFALMTQRGRLATVGPLVLALVGAHLVVVNEVSGFRDGEKAVRPLETAWAADVRAGVPADELADRHYPSYSAGGRAMIAAAVRTMRAHRYSYYSPPGGEGP